jgi:hypothetical protein
MSDGEEEQTEPVVVATRERKPTRSSIISFDANALAKDLAVSSNLKIENLANCKQITKSEFDELMGKVLKNCEVNEKLLELLENEKTPYLFSSDNLKKIIDTITSMKTKLAIILMLAPRLTDPRSKMDEFINIFRYADDKTKVEDALKNRAQLIGSSGFNRTSTTLTAGGIGGRGGMGRGSGSFTADGSSPNRMSTGRGGRGGPSRSGSMNSNVDGVSAEAVKVLNDDEDTSDDIPVTPVISPVATPVRSNEVVLEAKPIPIVEETVKPVPVEVEPVVVVEKDVKISMEVFNEVLESYTESWEVSAVENSKMRENHKRESLRMLGIGDESEIVEAWEVRLDNNNAVNTATIASNIEEVDKAKSIPGTSSSVKKLFTVGNTTPMKDTRDFDSRSLAKDISVILSLEPEESIGASATGLLYYRYSEVVRRNYCKQYDGLNKMELEMHLTDEEFVEKLCCTKDEFKAQPQWRKINKRKELFLF